VLIDNTLIRVWTNLTRVCTEVHHLPQLADWPVKP
jgi:hypothetical protein